MHDVYKEVESAVNVVEMEKRNNFIKGKKLWQKVKNVQNVVHLCMR